MLWTVDKDCRSNRLEALIRLYELARVYVQRGKLHGDYVRTLLDFKTSYIV